MSSPFPRLLLIGLLLTGAAPLSALPAVEGSWSLLGPDGGSVFDLISESDKLQVLYAAVDAGVFRSMDGGATWSWTGNGLDRRVPVATLAVDPFHPSTLYAGQSAGLFKSTNRGASWTRTSLGAFNVLKIAAHPRFSGTVFAATANGLYQSTNSGGRWKLLTRGLAQPHYSASWVSFDPANPRRMWTSIQGNRGGGLYMSLDGGFSWRPIHSGVMENQSIRALAIDRRSPHTLYAGTPSDVYKSTDDGTTWKKLRFPQFNTVLTLVAHPTQPNAVFAGAGGGLYLSQDGGETWTVVTQGLPSFGSVTVLLTSTSHPQILYAGVEGPDALHLRPSGVFRSADGGSSWTFDSRGLSASNVASVNVAAQDPDTLWSISDLVPFKSVDRGETWTAIEPGPPLSIHNAPPLVAIDPLDAAAVYIQGDEGLILRSGDGGLTWETGGNAGFTLALAIAPQHPATLWAASRQGGLLRSTDRGDTWTTVPGPASGGFYLALDIPPSAPSTVYAAGTLDFKARFVRTTDGGATWTLIQDGLPTPVAIVTADPLAPSTVWTVSGGDVYKSTDGGDHWTPVSSAFRNRTVKSLVASPFGSLYAVVDQDNVYESEDGGQSWAPFAPGPSFYYLNTLALDPKDPCRIYVATFNRGLLAFTKSGTAVCP
ncbi:MAG TPA: hypothetical protein VGS07_23625 [Thermoanaerobaculia bacterium]|jgi:photosystem II stability/assembly factor-like uncharacterized protein|nr:hypothetical protein [Thermoanaerobaculia bacterium]